MLVRESPRLAHSHEIVVPGGQRYRWAADEPRPENRPSRVTRSSIMPGGYEHAGCVLPRKPGTDYSDLAPYSTIVTRSASGEIVGEYRLDKTPRTSGDQMAVTPQAVGWQAHLDDDKTATIVYVDRDLQRWRGPSRARLLNLEIQNFRHTAPEMNADTDAGEPSILTGIGDPNWVSGIVPESEAWYDAGPGNLIAAVFYDWERTTDTNPASPWQWLVAVAPTDDGSTAVTATGNLRAASATPAYFEPAAPRRYARLFFGHTSSPNTGSDGRKFGVHWKRIAVYGPHGLTLHGDDPGGLLASDVLAYALARWAPKLTFTTGPNGTIRPSSFPIPQLAFHDPPTTVAEHIRQATRFELLDWAVWEHRTFHLHERDAGLTNRTWRARVGPAQLEETGQDANRVWNRVTVAYRDVDGSTRTVGPTGSGADTESEQLADTDPENPATLAGLIRHETLSMGTATAASATEIGRRFLEQAKVLDRSGRARLVGHVEDEHGILHPYSHVRAGDRIVFTDAHDHSPRRVVKADHDDDARAVTVDLDAPPQALDSLLERLDVSLVGRV